MEKQVRTALALLLIIILSSIIVYAILPYINYIFGGFILSVLFDPLYHFFLNKTRLSKRISAGLVIVTTIFLIMIPLYFFLNLIINEIQYILLDQESIMEFVQSISQIFSSLFSRFNIFNSDILANMEEALLRLVSEIINYMSVSILGLVPIISQLVIGILIMYFILYYLLTGEDSDFMHSLFLAIPFNTNNTIILLNEFKNIVKTTLIASGAIAIIEGGILVASFMFFGIRGAFLWGTIGGVLSFLPVVGAPLIWIPMTIILLVQENYAAAIGILATGVLLNIADNSFFRPVIQKSVGKIHPFQSLLGIVIGVSLFGIVGIVIGPLLLAYFYLTAKMFSEEYLSDKR